MRCGWFGIIAASKINVLICIYDREIITGLNEIKIIISKAVCLSLFYHLTCHRYFHGYCLCLLKKRKGK